MSSSQTPPQGAAGASDPSMEDILASIRRILSEEEPAAAPEPAPAAITAAETPGPVAPPAKSDDVLVLDASMLVPEEEPEEEDEPEAALPPPVPVPVPEPLPVVVKAEPMPMDALLAPEAEAAASHSVGTLVRTLATERTLLAHRGGPTIEDMVREELRPLLKQWLDANLPDMVERLVRTEIERVVHRAMP